MFFATHKENAERAAYIKSAYQDRYTEVILDGGVRVGYKPQEDGLLMWEGAYLSRSSESVFSWSIVADFTAQLIDKKEYFINTDIKPFATAEPSQQLSLFDFEYPETDGDTPQTTLFPKPRLSQQIIDEALCMGANDRHSRLIICAHFMKDYPAEQNAAFLREHYGTDGGGFILNGEKVSIWYNEDGIRISRGNSAMRGNNVTVVTWEEAAQRIRELLDLGRYMPQEEIDRARNFERETLADYILFIARDLTEEGRQAGYLPLLRLVLSEHSGFPDYTNSVLKLFEDPQMLAKLTDEWRTFTEAHAQNSGLLRFRFYNPQKSLEELEGIQREELTFTAAEGYAPKVQYFITQDEIDRLVRGTQEYRLSVYSFYCRHSDKKERENHLKNYHGEYEGSHGGNDNISWTRGKGISFSHGDIITPYAKIELKWSEIQKRTAELISRNQFLTDDDRAAMPEYERKQLATRIHNFFSGLSDEFPRPYKSNDISDYWEGVKEVQKLLTDPEKVKDIYENMMLPVWEQTDKDDRYYDRRVEGIEAMRQYLDGTFSVFGEQHPQEPLSYLEEVADLAKTFDTEHELQTLYAVLGRLKIDDITLDYDDEGLIATDSMDNVWHLGELYAFLINEAFVYTDDGGVLGVDEDLLKNFTNLADSYEVDIREHLRIPQPVSAETHTEELPAEKEQETVQLTAPKPRRERVRFTALYPEIPAEQRHNYRITDRELGVGTKTQKIDANLAAIRLLKQIEAEERLATPDEQEILSRYVGWGGLSECFKEEHSRYAELAELLTDEEMSAARASCLTAFYTSPVIVGAMYPHLSFAQNLGIYAEILPQKPNKRRPKI